MSALMSLSFSEWMTVGFVAALIFTIAGVLSDLVIPTIVSFVRRCKKTSGKHCPMLECHEPDCFYYDKKRLICKFADNSELIDPEVQE